ncbi:MAG: sensor histidine kinase [Spirochaetota bacterium]
MKNRFRSIRTRLLAGFLVTLGLVSAIGVYSTYSVKHILITNAGRQSALQAASLLQSTYRALAIRLEILENIADDPHLVEKVRESNDYLERSFDIPYYAAAVKGVWSRGNGGGEEPPAHRGAWDAALAGMLREVFVARYRERNSPSPFSEVQATNRYGFVVAGTGQRVEERLDEERWWIGARAQGFYVSETESPAADRRLVIALSILDEQVSFEGVLVSTVNLERLISETGHAEKRYPSTAVHLLGDRGGLLYTTDREGGDGVLFSGDLSTALPGAGGHVLQRIGGRELLLSYARGDPPSYLQLGTWYLVITHELREVLEPLAALRKNTVLGFAAALVLVSVVFVLLSRSLLIPLSELKAGVNRMGAGDLAYRVRVGRRDELGELADAFNRMAGRRRHAEQVLRESQERYRRLSRNLAESNRQLESFSYSVSHDLRAPLRAVAGFSEILYEEYEPRLDQEGKRLLGIIRDNVRKMGTLIDDLLTFSRLGRRKLEHSRVDMKALAGEVFEELREEYPREREVELRLGELPPARGDRSMVRLVLVNLVDNALKFTRGRAPAVIEIGWGPSPDAAVAEKQGNKVWYYVRDNGVGFDMKYRDKLFEVFQRLHSSEQFEGTGVGLANVRRIVQRHGGRVWAEGEPGKGAAVYFTLS